MRAPGKETFLHGTSRRLVFLGFALFFVIAPLHAQSGWGLNSRAGQGPPAQTRVELAELRVGRIVYLREDLGRADAWPRLESAFRPLTRAGYKIVGIIPYDFNGPAGDGREPAPDLRNVYREAEAVARRAGRTVSVWEIFNEPDIGFCRDLPDRSVAAAKAVYLGLKTASGKPVLLPSLGQPPGPWLERAAANGLLSYGDAFNLHYYGAAGDLGDLLGLTRRFLRDLSPAADQLPLWLTEIGIKTPDEAPDAPWERERQTRFFRDTTRTAADEGVAGFMPYAYRDGNYSLADNSYAAYPALALYLRESRDLELRAGPAWLDRAADANRVVLQWAPDDCLPDKISGAYEFTGGEMRGVVRLYNFGSRAVKGTLALDGLSQIRTAALSSNSITIPAMGRIDLPMRFTVAAPGYVRETANFQWHNVATGRESPLSFSFATIPRARDFSAVPITADRPTTRGFQWINAPAEYNITATNGRWIGLNGLKVGTARGALSPVRMIWTRGEESARRSWDLAGATFWLDPNFEPSEPTMAVARVDGLPASDFLRLRADRVLGRDFTVRVDLVDDRGERFTVFENNGVNYFHPSRELWLDWRDFHLFFWGRFPHRLHPPDPAAVREIQLRFHFLKTDDPVRLSFEAMKASALPPQ